MRGDPLSDDELMEWAEGLQSEREKVHPEHLLLGAIVLAVLVIGGVAWLALAP